MPAHPAPSLDQWEGCGAVSVLQRAAAAARGPGFLISRMTVKMSPLRHDRLPAGTKGEGGVRALSRRPGTFSWLSHPGTPDALRAVPSAVCLLCPPRPRVLSHRGRGGP